MATLKWKNNKFWETFFYGAFENIKADLRNIITAINNMAAAVRMRCRRDKNLSDLYSASDGRYNLQLINDCSDPSWLGSTTHHHDYRYIPMFRQEANARSSEDNDLWDAIRALQDDVEDLEDRVDTNMRVTILSQHRRWTDDGAGPNDPGEAAFTISIVSDTAKETTLCTVEEDLTWVVRCPVTAKTIYLELYGNFIPYDANTYVGNPEPSIAHAGEWRIFVNWIQAQVISLKPGHAEQSVIDKGHMLLTLKVNGNFKNGDRLYINRNSALKGYVHYHGLAKTNDSPVHSDYSQLKSHLPSHLAFYSDMSYLVNTTKVWA